MFETSLAELWKIALGAEETSQNPERGAPAEGKDLKPGQGTQIGGDR